MITLYIDPGTGSMLISALIALISVGFFMLKGFIYQKFNIGGSQGVKIDLSNEYGVVFYSEGKQYWNVFKPLLEEFNRRSIHITYFSSDKDDPGLNTNLEYVETQFIGTGREAYYFLNRLSAEMVVMTTPGLDVLEIKRSKNVKHYCHVTHAAGGAARYKSYGTDYYDSVLVGGDGDKQLVRELESKRNINAKDVKVIGCTYLDVYRDKLEKTKYNYTLFEEKRPTVLVSPTWGNHGLLTEYGDNLLSKLEKSDLFNVIIRPHPQSFISDEGVMEKLMNDYPNNDHRVWDREIDGLKAMAHADIMISDFSGIIFDFLFLFEKPILTMHGHYEKRGRDAMDLDEEPWDLRILDRVGQTINESDLKILPEIINETLSEQNIISEGIAQAKNDMDKYPGQSGHLGVDFMTAKLEQIKSSEVVEAELQQNNKSLASAELTLNVKKGIGFSEWIKIVFKTLTHPNTFLQIFITIVLFNIYIYFGNITFPNEGLNQIFLGNLFPYSLKLTIFMFIFFIGLTWWQGKGTLFFKKEKESFEMKGFLLLVLPMTPIVQYIISNQDILSFSESILVFIFFLIFSSVFIVFIPWLLSTVVSKNLTLSISLSFLFIIFNMANFGIEIRQLYISVLLIIMSILMFSLLFVKKKNLLLIALSIFFVANIGGSIFSVNSIDIDEENNVVVNDSKISEYTSGLIPKNTPDVFLLIYESYSNQETMDHYGFDNSNQTEYLLNQGFMIYDGTYSIGASSLHSMARVLHPELINGGAEELREFISGDAASLGLLNELDYMTHSVFYSDYFTRGYTPQYDFAFPDDKDSIDSHKIIIKAILEGEFRFDADFSKLEYETYIEKKQSVMSQRLGEPEFMYTHNKYPGHSQNSGVLRPDETDRHIKGINKANIEMRQDIESIYLENRDAIVIIAGDHGPYLTKNGIGLGSYDLDEINRMDIQDRYGTFLAISWPESAYADKHDIQILQDVLPAVISYMYDDDNLFDKIKMERETLYPNVVGGAVVRDGIVYGGIDDGKPLFENSGTRFNKNK